MPWATFSLAVILWASGVCVNDGGGRPGPRCVNLREGAGLDPLRWSKKYDADGATEMRGKCMCRCERFDLQMMWGHPYVRCGQAGEQHATNGMKMRGAINHFTTRRNLRTRGQRCIHPVNRQPPPLGTPAPWSGPGRGAMQLTLTFGEYSAARATVSPSTPPFAAEMRRRHGRWPWVWALGL